MPRPRFVDSLLATAFCLLSSACGTTAPVARTPIQPLTPPTTLTGNWVIAGSRTPAVVPMLSTTLVVNGNQITGQGHVEVLCSPQVGIGGSVSLSGQIADDGSFQTSYSTPSGSLGSYQVSLSGNSPTASSPALWTGNYSVTSSVTPGRGGAPCTSSQTAAFTAAPIAPFTATYTGPVGGVLFPKSDFGANAAYVLQVSQGQPIIVVRGPNSFYELPLSATLTVSGSPCFTSGTTTGSLLPSAISGDTFSLILVMNDGSQLLLSGSLNDPAGASLNVTSIANGGTCNNAFAITTLNAVKP